MSFLEYVIVIVWVRSVNKMLPSNPFLHRPFPLLPDWLHGLSDHLTFLLCSTVVLVSVLD